MIEMLVERLSSPTPQGGFLLDGFPRNVAAGRGARRAAGRGTAARSSAAGARRGRGRAGRPHLRPAASARTATLPRVQPAADAPGVCDVCGAPLYRRADDEPDVVRDRYRNVYLEQTAPVRDALRAHGTPEVAIDGTGSTDDVYARLRRAVERCLIDRKSPRRSPSRPQAGDDRRARRWSCCADAAAAGRDHRRARPHRRAPHQAARAASRRSRATAASRARSARRRTT